MEAMTHEINYNGSDQGHVAGFAATGDELWTVNSADSLNPADDSGQWLWSDEVFDGNNQWFDSMEDAIEHATAQTYDLYRSA